MVGTWLALVLTASVTAASAPVAEDRQLELNREARAQQEAGDLLGAADTWIEALSLAVTDLDVQNHFCGAIGALDRGLEEGGEEGGENEAIGARVDAHRDALEASAERLRRVDAVDNALCIDQWERLAAAFPAAPEEPEDEPEEAAEDDEDAPVEAAPVEPPSARSGGGLRTGLIVAGAITAGGAAAALATGFGAAHNPNGGFQGFAYKRVYEAAPPELRDSGAELCDGATGGLADACSGYAHTRRAFIATATITGLGVVTTAALAALILRRDRAPSSQRARLRVLPGVGGASLRLSF